MAAEIFELERQGSGEVPDFRVFRQTVERIESFKERVTIQTAYLLGLRGCELCSKVTPWALKSGKSKPYGSLLNYRFQDFELSKGRVEKASVFSVAQAKRFKRKQ